MSEQKLAEKYSTQVSDSFDRTDERCSYEIALGAGWFVKLRKVERAFMKL